LIGQIWDIRFYKLQLIGDRKGIISGLVLGKIYGKLRFLHIKRWGFAWSTSFSPLPSSETVGLHDWMMLVELKMLLFLECSIKYAISMYIYIYTNLCGWANREMPLWNNAFAEVPILSPLIYGDLWVSLHSETVSGEGSYGPSYPSTMIKLTIPYHDGGPQMLD
jgi:hypothetical protein